MKASNIFVTGFLVLTLLSTIFLIFSTLNYLEFYTAIKELKLSLKVSPQVKGERLILDIEIRVINPTSYKGLKLKSLSYRLSYRVEGESAELAAGQIWYSTAKPIQPYSELSLRASPSLDLEAAEKYLSHPEGGLWIVNCSALLETFTGVLRINLSYP